MVALRNFNTPLNYSNMKSIYESVEPMDVYFNKDCEAGTTTSTSDFMNALSSVAGSNVLNLNEQSWAAKESGQSYEDYYKQIGE